VRHDDTRSAGLPPEETFAQVSTDPARSRSPVAVPSPVDMQGLSPGYPADWALDAVLADGGTIHVRPIRPDDGERLQRFHARLSPETIYLRFFSPRPWLSPEEVEWFTHLDYEDRVALVAVDGDELAAVARYDRLAGTDEAEVAFVVQDDHQGRGVATLLLEYLAAMAWDRGIGRFVAQTFLHNQRMLRVFRDAGFERTTSTADGIVRVVLPIAPTYESVTAIEERERRAGARSMGRLLRPRTIAVIGAGHRRRSVGHGILRNLLNGDFAGTVYPVNRSSDHVCGVRAYPSVLDVPDQVDLAVIAVPGPDVAGVVDECIRGRVGSLLVISAGFAETSSEGADLERAMAERARRSGMRVVGPNCLGIINTDPDVRMNATFASTEPRPGTVGVLSQSGAVGIALLERAGLLHLGVSTFVSVGNKADVSGNDLLLHWEGDERTEAILLYLESFGNPRKFARIARRVSRSKPIVAVKSGRSSAGERAARSHTAAAATSDVAVEALFRQAGVIRVDTLEQLFDVGELLVGQPLPSGRRVAIVGNSGGPLIMAADACDGAGLAVPELAGPVQDGLRARLPLGAAVANPVDLTASATGPDLRDVLDQVLADEGIDAVIAVFTPTLVTPIDDAAAAIAAAAEHATKPVVANFLAAGETSSALPTGPGGERRVPVFAFPERAALALARVAAYSEWRAQPTGEVPDLEEIDVAAARSLVKAVLDEYPDGAWLDAASAGRLVASYGIAVAPAVVVSSPSSAGAAAEQLGYPVVLKAASGELVHKSDVGGVRLGLTNAVEVASAYAEMEAALGEAMGGGLVQAMVGTGVETIIGVAQDPLFGSLVMFGLGGVATDVLADRAFRLVPLTDRDAAELVCSVKAAPLLTGYRGGPKADLAALEELVLRVGRMALDLPEIVEMDLNPVMASPSGAVAVDVKIRLGPHPRGPDPTLRALR
jgi:acetyl coenzyme A synthetase (ADP forming)-like protein